MSTVTVDEVAGHARATREYVVALLGELGVEPAEDWRGRPVVAEKDARRVVELVQQQEAAHQARHEAWVAATKAHEREAQAVYDGALRAAQAEERTKQLADMRTRVEMDGSTIAALTVNGQRPGPGNMPPLDPFYEMRAEARAQEALRTWVEKHPAPKAEDVA